MKLAHNLQLAQLDSDSEESYYDNHHGKLISNTSANQRID
jgi:hypothetical protein